MEQVSLKDFIAKTLVEICDGIAEAKKAIKEKTNNCPIAPATVEGKPVHRETIVEFDVALTTALADSSKGGGGVDIKVISGDFEKEKKYSKESLHRIKFEAPFYPAALSK